MVTRFLMGNVGAQLRVSFADWQNLCEKSPQYLSTVQALDLYRAGMTALHFMMAASNQAASLKGFSWLILPKTHVFHHLLLDAKRELYNVRWYHNFSGEDFVGALKKTCMTCCGTGMPLRVLKRTLLRIVCGNVKEVDEFKKPSG